MVLGIDMFFYLFLMMFFVGMFIFCSMRKHLLISLLSLEYMVLCIFFYMILFFLNCLGDLYIIMLFMVFSVCEGVLGLSILVSMIRSHGNDQVNIFSILLW